MNFKSIKIIRNFNLSKLTTFKVGGPADILALPKNKNELIHLLIECKKYNIKPFILGGGSNIVFSDNGLRGLVIKLSGIFEEINIINKNEIEAGSTASFAKLTQIALNLGWLNALGWNGIPGTIGGALIMNSGSKFGCISELLENATIITPKWTTKILSNKKIQFSYRYSNFPENCIIIAAKFKCNKIYDKHKLEKKVKITTKKRKLSQPKLPSAGCIFKNPYKLFAAKLLEKAGLKGFKIGDAQISNIHANFIVNLGKAKAENIFELACYAQKIIYKKFNILLDFEVKFIN